MQHELKIYNSLSRQKEIFKPINPGKVGMYVCGPTVYGEPHLGHARSAIAFDVIFRYLQFIGYKVRYVRNITDVGHLEDENNDQGEDKISKKARLEQIEPMEVAQYYTNMYRNALATLNVLPPSIEPVASGHIPEQIESIQKIVDEGYAYESNGSVYFDVRKYNEKYKYGELSGRTLEDMLTGSRELDGQSEKHFAADFALWKKAEPEHLMQWSSPWGMGFPGWHQECTAMSIKYLGLPFDIHGGGMDLKFPHHEAEISQCVGGHGCHPANYWIHNNMVTLDGQKMAKSKGNYISFKQMLSGDHPLLEQAYTPMNIRFFMLQAHYSSTLDFSNSALKAADSAMKRLMNALKPLEALKGNGQESQDKALEKKIHELTAQCYEKMGDDFNTAETIACLFEMSSIINTLYNTAQRGSILSEDTVQLLHDTYTGFLHDVLGLKSENESNDGKLNEVMHLLLELRNQAKKDKNYALSDTIRKELTTLGIAIMDNKDGTTDYQIN
jgi:cysteinyl-tRNA synthetase